MADAGDAQLVPMLPATAALDHHYPPILERAGAAACFAAGEFAARHRNPHTRRAYGRAVSRFLQWCERKGVELRTLTPAHAGQYIDGMAGSVSSQKLALAALRQFCNLLVTRHAIALNPFLSVTGPRQSRGTGRTPEITVPQARHLLASIDCSRAVGLRDRAVIGMLTYTGARVGAIAALRLQDLRDYGTSAPSAFGKSAARTAKSPCAPTSTPGSRNTSPPLT